MRHPFVEYVNMPNQKTPYFSTNSLGFRGEREVSPQHEKKRVIIVGGSAAFGTGLKSDEETFAVQLEKILANVEVINASVVGYLSGNELAYIITELIDLSPDAIIALDGWNDFVAQMRPPPRTVYTRGASNSFFYAEDRLRKFHELESFDLIRRMASATRLLFLNIGRLFNKAVQDSQIHWLPDADPAALGRQYAGNIIKMQRVAGAFHCKLICVLQPYRGLHKSKFEDEIEKNYHLFLEETKKYFKQNSLIYIDLNDFKEQIRDGMFIDWVHLNVEGNVVIAQLVFELIQREKLFDQSALK